MSFRKVGVCVQHSFAVRNKIIAFFLLIGLCSVRAFSGPNLTPEEMAKISSYAEKVSLKAGIGQLLMVGVASDVAQSLPSDEDRKIFSELGVGGAFLNNYNSYVYGYKETQRREVLQQIASLNLQIQNFGQDSPLHLPIITAVDFEGPRISSMQRGIYQAPPSLTLGATGEPDLIRLTGHLIAHELRVLGIQILAGPVLDVDITEQGKFSSTIKNRAFASSANNVYSIASNYIAGLREGGIGLIAKHFPGLGAAEGDPYEVEIPKYKGGVLRLTSDLEPYPSLRNFVDGIMTSHLSVVPLFQQEPKPITFSRTFIDNLIRSNSAVEIDKKGTLKGIGYQDHVVMTDDLSSMGCIISYMGSKKSYGDIACEAFDAGHDLLLFSHFEAKGKPKRGEKGNFTFQELCNVEDELIRFIERSDSAKRRFRESLTRILYLKASLGKNYGISVDQFLSMSNLYWPVNVQSALEQIEHPDFLEKNNKFTNPKSLLAEVYKNATLLLSVFEDSEVQKYDLSKVDTRLKVAFCSYDAPLAIFRESFGSLFPSAVFFEMKQDLKGRDFSRYAKRIEDLFKSSDLFVITCENPNDSKIVNGIVTGAPKDCREKMVVLLHTTPKILESQVFYDATVFGSFSADLISFEVDAEVLQGRFKPGPISKLPIGLGANNNIWDPTDSLMTPADGYYVEPYFRNKQEAKAHRENEELKSEIKELKKTVASMSVNKEGNVGSRVGSIERMLIGGGAIIFCGAILLGLIIVRHGYNKSVTHMLQRHDAAVRVAIYRTLFIERIRGVPLWIVLLIIVMICLLSFCSVFGISALIGVGVLMLCVAIPLEIYILIYGHKCSKIHMSQSSESTVSIAISRTLYMEKIWGVPLWIVLFVNSLFVLFGFCLATGIPVEAVIGFVHKIVKSSFAQGKN
jgi:beta-glucosidase-like glycosyl hydrolase